MSVATKSKSQSQSQKCVSQYESDPMKYPWEIDEICCVPGEQRITVSIRGDLVGSLAHTLRHSPEGICKMAGPLRTLAKVLFRAGDAIFGDLDPLLKPRLAPVIILPDGTVDEGEPFDPREESYEIEDVA